MTFLVKFWSRHPALLYGLYAMVGVSLALDSFWLPLIPIFLVLTITSIVRFLLAGSLGAVVFLFVMQYYQFPTLDDFDKIGVAEIEIKSIVDSQTLFGGRGWSYKADLKHFMDGEGKIVAKNIPVSIFLPTDKNERKEGSFFYHLQGKLKKTEKGNYRFIPDSKTNWSPSGPSWNFSEWRFWAKKKLRESIQKKGLDFHVSAFLSGIATGEFDDLFLSDQLGRFGLQHLMAISGLHFSILASILGLGLSLLFSRNIVALGMILLLSAYFVFLGLSPSVMRAWISLIVVLCGILIERRAFGLNTLGIGILMTMFFDPLAILQVGFQFSFAVTAAILLLFRPCDALLLKIFKKRPLSQVILFDWIDQHVYCLLSFFRQGLALTLAVNIVALPITLFYFQKFPLMGLLYNLFFPGMVSLSMFFLAMGLFFSPFFSTVSDVFHSLNNGYTLFLLNFTFNLPGTFDYTFRFEGLSSRGILCYLFVVFTLAIYLKHKDKKGDDTPEWMV